MRRLFGGRKRLLAGVIAVSTALCGTAAAADVSTNRHQASHGAPLTVLTDRNCASACDPFSAAAKDLHVARLVGTRTSGVVAGAA